LNDYNGKAKLRSGLFYLSVFIILTFPQILFQVPSPALRAKCRNSGFKQQGCVLAASGLPARIERQFGRKSVKFSETGKIFRLTGGVLIVYDCID
jgi:hypothetical protein